MSIKHDKVNSAAQNYIKELNALSDQYCNMSLLGNVNKINTIVDLTKNHLKTLDKIDADQYKNLIEF